MGCHKIRLAIDSKGKGKSGGVRVIVHIQVTHETVHLLSVYDKSDEDTIPKGEIKRLVALIV